MTQRDNNTPAQSLGGYLWVGLGQHWRVKVALDANGDPTGESSTFNYRDTAACTKRRREYTRRNLIGRSSKTAKQRRKNNHVSAVGTRGTKPSKKNSAKGAPSTSAKKAA